MKKYKLIFTGLLLNVVFLYASQPFFINDGLSPLISEFLASNNSVIKDEDGDYSDWIELYNPTDDTINLFRWFLSDDSHDLLKWAFPSYKLAPSAYLVVFLSGKSKVYNGGEIHADFKLSAAGESLILTKSNGLTRAWYFDSIYPVQYEDISFGLSDSVYTYLNNPTPGNENSLSEFIPEPVINMPHGLYDQAIDVSITTKTQGAKILYTLDGKSPLEGGALEYNSVLHFDSTALVRAVVIKEGIDTGNVITRSYIYPKYVLQQPVLPKGYPEFWGEYTAREGRAPGDYEMDPDVVNRTEYKDSMILSLSSIPTISIVTDKDHFFLDSIDFNIGGIYMFTGAPITDFTSDTGKNWQRPASVEYILPDGEDGFQINCGIQLNGGHSRRPEKCPKHSFRLIFSSKYGPGKLEYDFFPYDTEAENSFDRLILRGGFNNAWTHSDRTQRQMAQYIHDSWAKDTQLAMGHVAAHNNFAHVYINGLYWGMYNASERIDNEFMQSYFGGNDDDFDIIKDYTEPIQGNLDAFNEMTELLNQDITADEVYQKIMGNNPDGTPNTAYPVYVDPVSLIDYMLINIYGGNSDWDHHNWAIGRNRVEPGTGFKFFIWDAEHILERLEDDVTMENNPGCPSFIFQRLALNKKFKKLMEERISLHFYNDGLLTPSSVVERWNKRAKEVRIAIMSESARWGDYRSPTNPYTLHNHWNIEYRRLTSTYFPARTQIVIDQLKMAGFYPMLSPPLFSQYGGIVPYGYKLSILADTGTIFYTLNGEDPMTSDGGYSPNAQIYNAGSNLIIQNSVSVNARVQSGDDWSALASATFSIDPSTNFDQNLISAQVEEIKLYPNPVNNISYLEYYLTGNQYLEISIFTSTGRMIKKLHSGYQHQGRQYLPIDAGSLTDGVYFIKLIGKGINKNIKFMVIK